MLSWAILYFSVTPDVERGLIYEGTEELLDTVGRVCCRGSINPHLDSGHETLMAMVTSQCVASICGHDRCKHIGDMRLYSGRRNEVRAARRTAAVRKPNKEGECIGNIMNEIHRESHLWLLY